MTIFHRFLVFGKQPKLWNTGTQKLVMQWAKHENMLFTKVSRACKINPIVSKVTDQAHRRANMIFPILMYGDLAHQNGAVICNEYN